VIIASRQALGGKKVYRSVVEQDKKTKLQLAMDCFVVLYFRQKAGVLPAGCC